MSLQVEVVHTAVLRSDGLSPLRTRPSHKFELEVHEHAFLMHAGLSGVGTCVFSSVVPSLASTTNRSRFACSASRIAKVQAEPSGYMNKRVRKETRKLGIVVSLS